MKPFLFSLLFFTTFLFTQSRIGYTESQILEEFKEAKITKGDLDGVKYLSFTNYRETSAAYQLNDKGVCYETIVYPLNSTIFTMLFDKYNKEYIVISKTEWQIKNKDKTITSIKLHLKSDSDPTTYFTFKFLPFLSEE